MDQDQMDSIEVYDPVKKRHFHILVANNSESNDINDQNEEIIIEQEPVKNNITVWTQHETLALINIFSLYKDQFNNFKKRKGGWNLISQELEKLGIHKPPEKCDVKWRNLLRIYRQHKNGYKRQGKFEFFNELDDIISNDPQYLIANINGSSTNEALLDDSIDDGEVQVSKKRKCSCIKNDKQKRHEDRMALMTKKMEIEERKVRAFEDYLKFLKDNARHM